jgi:hypothetical protein
MRSSASGDTRARTVVRSLMQRTDHAIIESFHTILLFLTNLRLGFDDVPELNDIILDLLNVNQTRDMVGAHHLLNICLKLAHILPVDFGIDYLTLLIDFGVRCGRRSDWTVDKAVHIFFRNSLPTILVQQRLTNDTAAVIQKFLTKLLSGCISLALSGIAPIDHKLHEFDEIGIGTVHDGDATGSDLIVDSGEVAEGNIVEHEESVLTDPIPRGVETASFERVENWPTW